jgi:monoamine oxidase
LTKTDVLIVGGGLSGLRHATLLSIAGIDFQLIEARNRLGGRILSLPLPDGSEREDRYDLGPAWYWPDQPRMSRLVDELDLVWFEQMSLGNMVVQENSGDVRGNFPFLTMAGARRLVGGMQTLIEALAGRLKSERLLLGHRLQSLEAHENWIAAEIEAFGHQETISARAIVIALPPRLAIESVAFAPALDQRFVRVLSDTPTWMAGQAKFVAVYDQPFWRAKGLSGDVISRHGPLVEVHDASPASGREGALFGFVGVPVEKRRDYDNAIINASIAQMATLFGEEAGRPKSVLYEDWSRDRLTATARDAAGALTHPSYGPTPPLDAPWRERVFFASSETARQYGGYLEGALEAPDQVAKKVMAVSTAPKRAREVRP